MSQHNNPTTSNDHRKNAPHTFDNGHDYDHETEKINLGKSVPLLVSLVLLLIGLYLDHSLQPAFFKRIMR